MVQVHKKNCYVDFGLYLKLNIMAIIEKTYDKPVIDLTGPEGNAFYLIGYAMRLAKELNMDVQKLKEEMMSSDYENVVNIFDANFGEYVDLMR